MLHETGRAEYVPVTDEEAVEAFEYLSRTEGIIPAIESAHAVAHVMKMAKTMDRDKIIVCTISGRGDKNVAAIARYRGWNCMSNIGKDFENGKAFIAFVTGGDPDLETTERILYAMKEAGADLIEIGIPFSDPIAEGAVIQEANERSLKTGCTTDKLFDLVKKARKKVKVPIVYLTYANAVVKCGKEKFLKRCAECGIDGLIVPDIPFEEKGELAEVCQAHGVDLISMIAPTSHDRIKMIAKEAKGFVYCVSSMGVTGVRSEIKTDIGSMVRLVKEVKDIPCAIGFGIATPDQAERMAALSDGAIAGSTIVKLAAEYRKDAPRYVGEYVRSMKEAVKRAE